MTELDPFTDVLDGPVYVVTAASGGEREGCLVGFASQCSGDHVGFLLAPAAVCPPAEGPPPPLLRYRELRDLEPGHPA
ncbi:hypothetical protein [Streptomyces sp. DSM 40907]|uniref:hypothetical protein n=1 Tax=Streptomyces kutzneri TaxID=3051179 RepID=UPI0028D00D4A|nr:hypothetical protein [Streptomyces sp. DSM 40907]